MKTFLILSCQLPGASEHQQGVIVAPSKYMYNHYLQAHSAEAVE